MKSKIRIAMKRTTAMVPRTKETIMFVRVRSAFEERRSDCIANAEVAAGFGNGVIDILVPVTVLIKFEDVDDVTTVVVTTVGRMVRTDVTVVEFGGGNVNWNRIRFVELRGGGRSLRNASPTEVGNDPPPPLVRLDVTDIQDLFSCTSFSLRFQPVET
jgi:hypothetical protein